MASFSEAATASAIRVVTNTGSHLFKVFGYSLTKGIGIGKFIESDVFTVAGYDWIITYYPDGHTYEDKDFIYLSLELKSAENDVKTSFSFDIHQQNGLPFDKRIKPESKVVTFNSTTAIRFSSWGYRFANRKVFETSECLKDDAFTVKCTVTIVKGTKVSAINSFGVVVPPSTLNQNLSNMLESGKGADIRFLVKDEEFSVHRCVLAARSAVFNAMLFGCMKEKGTDTIKVDDIEAPVFKCMLHFIYSDSLPSIEGEQHQRLMAEHLFVAADRYALERLRLMCGDVLSKNLSVSNVVATMILAERHNCNQLKAQCLRFMSLPSVFKEVALTDNFKNLMRICPSVLQDIQALKLKCSPFMRQIFFSS